MAYACRAAFDTTDLLHQVNRSPESVTSVRCSCFAVAASTPHSTTAITHIACTFSCHCCTDCSTSWDSPIAVAAIAAAILAATLLLTCRSIGIENDTEISSPLHSHSTASSNCCMHDCCYKSGNSTVDFDAEAAITSCCQSAMLLMRSAVAAASMAARSSGSSTATMRLRMQTRT